MKRKLSILFITIATFLLVLFAIIPHHHHHGLSVCMVMELCDNNDPITEDHQQHHSTDDIGHEECCIADVAYIIRGNEVRSKCCVNSGDPASHIHLYPVYFLVADFLIHNDLEEHLYGTDELILNYRSINASRINGLRAPPYFLF